MFLIYSWLQQWLGPWWVISSWYQSNAWFEGTLIWVGDVTFMDRYLTNLNESELGLRITGKIQNILTRSQRCTGICHSRVGQKLSVKSVMRHGTVQRISHELRYLSAYMHCNVKLWKIFNAEENITASDDKSGDTFSDSDSSKYTG